MQETDGRNTLYPPWRIRRGVATLLHTLCVFSPGVARSQSGSAIPDTLRLTVASARSLALRGNPGLKAAGLDIRVARGDLRQASVLLRSNPEANVLAGTAGPELGVAQEVEIAGQRGARRSAARAEVDRATASVLNQMRTTLGDVDRAFYRLVAADRRGALASEVLGVNRRLADFSQRQLAAGEISRLEFNLAIVELGRSRARATAAQRERGDATRDLLLLLGANPSIPVTPVSDDVAGVMISDSAAAHAALDSAVALLRLEDSTLSAESYLADTLNLDSLTAVAVARRPDLGASDALVRRAIAGVSVARRDAFPNLVVRGSSEPPAEGSSIREFRPGVGLTLPIFNLNRGEIAARRAAAAQAHLARAATLAVVRSDVARAVAKYRAATREKEILETTVLGPARENRRLLEIAFREGKVGLPVLLLIRNQVVDAELEFWEAWLGQHEALAALSEATGALVIDLTAPRQ